MKKSELTRAEILKKSMEVIYKKGYHAATIDDMLKATQVTKGAFFYHFKSKDDMCLHMLKEVFSENTYTIWVKPLENSLDPISDILKLLREVLYDDEGFDVRYGCHMINLIEEISPNNALLRKELRVQSMETYLERYEDRELAYLLAVKEGADAKKLAAWILTTK